MGIYCRNNVPSPERYLFVHEGSEYMLFGLDCTDAQLVWMHAGRKRTMFVLIWRGSFDELTNKFMVLKG
jgi:hypothetical protein